MRRGVEVTVKMVSPDSNRTILNRVNSDKGRNVIDALKSIVDALPGRTTLYLKPVEIADPESPGT